MSDTLKQPSGQKCIVCLAEKRGLIKALPNHACGLVMVPDSWDLPRYPEEERKLALSLAGYLLKVREQDIPEFKMHAASKTTVAGADPTALPPGSLIGRTGAKPPRKTASKPPRSR